MPSECAGGLPHASVIAERTGMGRSFQHEIGYGSVAAVSDRPR